MTDAQALKNFWQSRWENLVREAAEARAQWLALEGYKTDPQVTEKEQRNEWDHLRDFIPVWKAQQEGKWLWYANSRCKYVELRIDMRDGGCIIKDRWGARISPAQLAYQYKADADDPEIKALNELIEKL